MQILTRKKLLEIRNSPLATRFAIYKIHNADFCEYLPGKVLCKKVTLQSLSCSWATPAAAGAEEEGGGGGGVSGVSNSEVVEIKGRTGRGGMGPPVPGMELVVEYQPSSLDVLQKATHR